MIGFDEKVQQLFAQMGFKEPLTCDQLVQAFAGTLVRLDPDFEFQRQSALARARNVLRIGEMLRLTEIDEQPRRVLQRRIREFEAASDRAATYRKRFDAGPSGTEHDLNWPVSLDDVLVAEEEARGLRDAAEAAQAELAGLRPKKSDAQRARDLASALKKGFARAADAACQIYKAELLVAKSTSSKSNVSSDCHERASKAAAEAFAKVIPTDRGSFVYEVLLGVEDETKVELAEEDPSETITSLKRLFLTTLENALPIRGLTSVYSRWRRSVEAGGAPTFPLSTPVEDYLSLIQHHQQITDAIKRNVAFGS